MDYLSIDGGRVIGDSLADRHGAGLDEELGLVHRRLLEWCDCLRQTDATDWLYKDSIP